MGAEDRLDSWKEIAAYLKRDVTTVQRWEKEKGLPIRRLTPDKDKLARALVAQARYQEHRVYHLERAPWLRDWEDELLAFPNGAHNDQVDTAAYAGRELPSLNLSDRARGGSGTVAGGMLTRQL